MRIVLFLLLSLLLFNTHGITQNVGIGTNTPVSRLHIANGDMLVDSGKVVRSTTGIDRNLVPVAIGSINSTGQVTAGTKNITSTYSSLSTSYTIDIGEDNTYTEAFVTASGLVGIVGTATPLAAPSNTKYTVRLYTLAGSLTTGNFSFIVYNTGRDTLKEYTITIARDTNSITIGNGTFGINQNADSITLNIIIPDTVIIGGGDGNPAIRFTNLPSRTGITINNYGQIVGQGGDGGNGDGTYQASSTNTTACSINGTAGSDGGDAIITSVKLTVNNYGFLAGAGGGGGGAKRGNAAAENGGGGGRGAGWPIPAGSAGSGGGTYRAVNQNGVCTQPPPPVCSLPGGCCCGASTPFAADGTNGTYSGGNNFIAGTGGAGTSGGHNGRSGGALGNAGASNANSYAGGATGKAVKANSGLATGSIINNLGVGQTIGIVE